MIMPDSVHGYYGEAPAGNTFCGLYGRLLIMIMLDSAHGYYGEAPAGDAFCGLYGKSLITIMPDSGLRLGNVVKSCNINKKVP